MTNFKIEQFKGTLMELIVECNPHFSDQKVINSFNEAHAWLIDQFDNVNNNIIPVRKFQEFNNKRGSLEIFENSTSQFMPVDNEPFCFFYAKWIAKESHNESLKVLFKSKKVPASWNCDAQDKNDMKFSGVSTSFRDNGLKLAHINDAGKLGDLFQNSKSNNEIRTRFLRSLSPLNVFLFPNYRCSKIVSSTYNPSVKDWAEDEKIRQIALSYLISKLKISKEFFNVFSPSLHYLENWEEIANEILVEIIPKSINKSIKKKVKKAKVLDVNNIIAIPLNACPRYLISNCLIEEAIQIYKKWRNNNPDTVQLDGGNKSNPSKWIKFEVEGYTVDDSHTSDHGPTFSGDEYNGIVNFHGDAKCEKIDLFVELYEQAESYRDVLVPFETQMRKGVVKPKFALKGYEETVDGFYLYHDEWSDRQKKAS